MSGIRRVSDLGSKGVSTYVDGSIQAADLSPTISLSGFRNVIINGGFDIWQRGTTGFATTDGTYTADRWRHTSNGLTITRDTDVPSGFRYSAKLVGTGDNSFAQRIEAATASKLALKQVVFSCWAKRTSGTGALDVRFYYPSAEDNFTTNTQIGSTIILSSLPSSSWTYYTATITLPSNVSTGLMMLINNVGASTTFITGVQLEQNLQATPFEQRPIGVELGLCQRYYERFQLDNAAITRTIGPGGWDSATSFSLSLMFKTLKRTTPTMSSSNSGFQVLYHGLAWYTGTTTTFTEPSVYGVRANIASSGSAVQGQAGIAVLANTSAFMAADSEL
jgi:hypothetical protein